jgi:hypothetical protein
VKTTDGETMTRTRSRRSTGGPKARATVKHVACVLGMHRDAIDRLLQLHCILSRFPIVPHLGGYDLEDPVQRLWAQHMISAFRRFRLAA